MLQSSSRSLLYHPLLIDIIEIAFAASAITGSNIELKRYELPDEWKWQDTDGKNEKDGAKQIEDSAPYKDKKSTNVIANIVNCIRL